MNIEVDNLVKIYEKSPPDVRAQILSKLGLTPSTEEPISPSQGTVAKDLHTIIKGNADIEKGKHDMQMNEQAGQLEENKVGVEAVQRNRDQDLSEKQANKPEPAPTKGAK